MHIEMLNRRVQFQSFCTMILNHILKVILCSFDFKDFGVTENKGDELWLPLSYLTDS